jgi:hypothetical protein
MKANQPIPGVTRKDIERVVSRDFPVSQSERVFSILAQYGAENWHREPERVRIAALKLAGGNLERLIRAIATAHADYRDVLAQAEYPAYLQSVDPSSSISSDQRQQISDADWKQFREWFER